MARGAEVITFDNPGPRRPPRAPEEGAITMAQRRHHPEYDYMTHRRGHRGRHNPEGNPEGNPGFTSDFASLVKTGALTATGFALATVAGRAMPTEIKSNMYLSPISKGVAALALLSIKGSIPGGSAVAEQVAAGMATAGVIEAAAKIGGASFPGIQYLPTLPANTGGGPGMGPMAPRQLPPPAPASGPLFKAAAYSPDVVL